MEYIVVAYRSRESTIKLHEMLLKLGINNQIINTPKEAGVGCGLSVKIEKIHFLSVRRIAFKINLKSFAGFFEVKTVGGKRIVRSI